MVRSSLFVLAAVAVDAETVYKSGKCGDRSKWHYDLWAPDVEGTYPVMAYVTGGGGVAPGFSYSNIAKDMAEKGMIVTMFSRPAPPEPKTDASLEAKALQWLEDALPSMGLKAAGDFDKLVLAGHSAGNHVTCEFLKSDCGKAKAVVMMDPVDGYDPFGIINNYCITPGEKLPFDIPALLLRTGLDPKVKVMVACAPDRISNQRYFNAWSGPIWMVNATKYGHLDVNDPGAADMGGIICATDNEPKDSYRVHVANMVDAFVSMVFNGDATAESKLNDASTMGVDAEVQNDYNGHSAPFVAGCSHSSAVTV
jgi:hypothetical protein